MHAHVKGSDKGRINFLKDSLKLKINKLLNFKTPCRRFLKTNSVLRSGVDDGPYSPIS